MRLREYAQHHSFAGVLLLLWLWVSLSLIIGLWLKHPNDSVLRRLTWTLVLCLPFFGWLAYGAFYHPLRENDVPAPVNNDITGGGS